MACLLQPIDECKLDACLLFSGYYRVIDYNDNGNSHPGARRTMRPLL
jgi:hypothetical protein